MSNDVIRAELETRLFDWAQAQNPKVPIAFESAPFTKPETGVFLEAFLIPNVTIDADVAATRKRLVGIFQVNCWARSGKGMGEVDRLAASVIDAFPVVPKSGEVSIEQTPYADKSLSDNSGWVIVPVTIMYRYESS